MKFTLGLLITLTLFAVLVLSGCDNPSNKMEDTGISEIESTRNLEIAANEEKEEVRVFRVKNSERFKEFNRTTSEIEQQIENEADEEVRERLKSKLSKYEEIQRELNHEIDNFQTSRSDNWDKFKDNFNDKMNDLDDSLNDLSSTTSTNN